MLVATDQGIADELAAAAGVYLGKGSGTHTPVVVASKVETPWAPGSARELVHDPEHDLFRT